MTDTTPYMRVEVPGFVLHEELGRGGYAVVFRATESAFRRDVALKVLVRFDLDDEQRRRFRRECETAGALSWHPHVVTVFGQGVTSNGFPYLSMEYLPGGNLADLVARSGPIPWRQALGYGAQLADALAAAHEVGFLHRDVKPENSLIDRFGNVKLADFGIAAITTGTRTATGIVTATVIHAAPEVLAGQRASSASDLYSLGSTLHTLLAGSPPFLSVDDENVFALLYRIANGAPADLRSVGVPSPVAVLVEQLLAKDPDDRPADATSLGETMRDLANNDDADHSLASEDSHGLTDRRGDGDDDLDGGADGTSPGAGPADPLLPALPALPEIVLGVDNDPPEAPMDGPADDVPVENAATVALVATYDPPDGGTFDLDPSHRATSRSEPASAGETIAVAVSAAPTTPLVTPTARWTRRAPWVIAAASMLILTALVATRQSGDGERSPTTTLTSGVPSATTQDEATSGRIFVVAGFTSIGDDGPAVDAQLNGPQGVAVGADGTVYIADTFSSRVRRVGVDGTITTIAGTGTHGFGGDDGPAVDAQLNFPGGVAVGADGTVYIADTESSRVRRVGVDGTITTIAGTGTDGFGGDDGPAVDAQLNGPQGVAVGADGTVYIADTESSRVLRVAP